MTRVLGVDPGSRSTGFGVVDAPPDGLRYMASGCIEIARARFPSRLAEIYRGMEEVIAAHGPDECAVEAVFFAHNPQSALRLGQARGAAIAAVVGPAFR